MASLAPFILAAASPFAPFPPFKPPAPALDNPARAALETPPKPGISLVIFNNGLAKALIAPLIIPTFIPNFKPFTIVLPIAPLKRTAAPAVATVNQLPQFLLFHHSSIESLMC